MIKIREAIVVEGRYDKAALAGLVDTVILDTAGFGIFSDREKVALLRRLAKERGLVVLTDSDGGGFVIRNFLKSAIEGKYVKHAYIPDVYGKERRKRAPGKEGKLGVEGMKPEVLLESLRRAGVELDAPGGERTEEAITKAELYAMGLTGRPDSAVRRAFVLKALALPERLTTNALLDVLNVLTTRQELMQILQAMETEEKDRA